MGKKILIIDDELHIIKIIMFKLKAGGYDVLYALNGADGIDIAKEKTPDIILLDIMMPVMNGYEVFEILKEDERTKDIPVVMVTAKIQESDKLKAEKLGIEEYIFKPFSPQAVLDTVKRIIEK